MPGESKFTRVQPAFEWLRDHATDGWPQDLLNLSSGLKIKTQTGALHHVHLDPEQTVAPSTDRLAWMIENADALEPETTTAQTELKSRVLASPARSKVAADLRNGVRQSAEEHRMVLEGHTHCDCMIDCDNVLIWIEGKRRDWLATGTRFDRHRDQLARDLEAAQLSAQSRGRPDFCLILCHETPLTGNDKALVDEYRSGQYPAGTPHLKKSQRTAFRHRIGTVTWAALAQHWPELQTILPGL